MIRNKNRLLVMLLSAILLCGCLTSCGKSDNDKNKSSEDVLTEMDAESTEALDDSTETVLNDTNVNDTVSNNKSNKDSASSNKSNPNSASSNKSSRNSASSNKSNPNSASSNKSNPNSASSNKSNQDSASSESSSSASSGSSSSNSSNSSTHSHTWEAVKTVVHHDEVGHYEENVQKAAYDETSATRVYDPWKQCVACGAEVTAKQCTCGSSELKTVYYKTVTETIHHDAECGTSWVVDTAAYDEEIITGYKCSGCGATK